MDRNTWLNYQQKFLNFPFQIDEESSIVKYNRVVSFLAETHNLTIYDATYLELAIRRNIPLATLDKELYAAADKVGLAFRS